MSGIPNPYTQSGPHTEEPLVAPQPWKVEPDIGINMARQLETQIRPPSFSGSGSSNPPHPAAFAGGFRSPSPYHSHQPPPQPTMGQAPFPGGFTTSPPSGSYPTPGPYPPPAPNRHDSLNSSMAKLSFLPPDQQRPPARSPAPQLPQTKGAGELTAALPNIEHLTDAIPVIQNPSHDASLKVSFIRDTLFLVERASPEAPSGQQLNLSDPALTKLLQVALPALLTLANSTQQTVPGPLPPHIAEVLYLKAKCEASGYYPQFFPHSPRQAFRDFEAAARGGWSAAWFRLGRDYEQFGDNVRAKDCFERGVKAGDSDCAYRLGIAHLLCQLTFTGKPSEPQLALPLLLQSARSASLQTPQGPYVLALLMMREFPSLPSDAQLPESLFWNSNLIPQNSSLPLEAKKWLERSAYLHFPPAQYKIGNAYEFATPPFPYRPLLSIQYYSLASQAGETEADMALSKWFLCGADGGENGEGGFEKDESLALTFARKAAMKGLPSAEFAMGYYAEVGIGGNKNLEAARVWYEKASSHGNSDAPARLQALQAAASFSRQEHEQLTNTTLVRKRTQAKERSDAQGYKGPIVGSGAVIDNIRKSSAILPPIQEPPRPLYSSPQPIGAESRPDAAPPPFQGHQGNLPMSENSLGPGTGLRPPKSAGHQQLAQLHRVSLSDSGPTPRPPSSGTSAQAATVGGRYGPAGGKQVTGGVSTTTPPTSPPPAKKPGPATFAEMGIQGVGAQDKECLIM